MMFFSNNRTIRPWLVGVCYNSAEQTKVGILLQHTDEGMERFRHTGLQNVPLNSSLTA